MEEDVLPARPRVSTGHPTHSTGSHSSCPAQPWSIHWTRQWDQLRIRGDWAGLGRTSCFQLSDKDAGPTSLSVPKLRASPSLFRAQLHIGECGPGAGHDSPFPGLDDLPGDAPHPSAQRRVLSGISVAVTFPAAVPSPHAEALAGPNGC